MISVKLSELAQKQVKDLRKKYHSIPNDISILIDEIEVDPTNAVDLGGNIYKKRFAISSKGKGKSGSGRAIYVLYQLNLKEDAVIVEVFDKSDKENISAARLKELKKLYKDL
ncbi:MAG: hypothetical protein EOP43_04730 [Sphingobacteriaceae bacterium]|nr:MAG: hypothetical protein EOP43_04730 [Sphingobacteriaceae bacterium]